MVNGKTLKSYTLRPPTHTINKPNVIRRRTAPYSREIRALMLLQQVHRQGNVPMPPGVMPSARSVRRWRQRLNQHGTYFEYAATGNARATVLRGPELAFRLQILRHILG